MKGSAVSTILGIFLPLSFYCCLSGTILTLILLPFSFKFDKLKNPVKKLATIFAIVWILNIAANFFALFTHINVL